VKHTREEDVDKELVRRVLAGDEHAYDFLVLKYQHRIVKVLSRFVHDNSEVLDVAQEVFLRAYRALARFKGESAFYTWLYRIAVNAGKNYAASRSHVPSLVVYDSCDPDATGSAANLREEGGPEHMLIRDEVQLALDDVIEHLPSELKEALILREIEGLSYEEIAEKMQCPVGTVRSRIFRAREAVDKRIKPIMGEE